MSQTLSNAKKTHISRSTSRLESVRTLEELVQCGICLEKLQRPKMLPCQHTFCLACFKTHATKKGQGTNSITVPCPNDNCKQIATLSKGLDGIDSELPGNLYIESLLQKLDDNEEAELTSKCVKCQTICKFHDETCGHCKMVFCLVCWPQHADDLYHKIDSFSSQLDNIKKNMTYKEEERDKRYDFLKDAVEIGTREKMETLKRKEAKCLQEINRLEQFDKTQSEIIRDNIKNLSAEIQEIKAVSDKEKVAVYMQMHKQISILSNQISHIGENHKIFDSNTFSIEDGFAGKSEDESAFDVVDSLDSKDSVLNHYKSRSFELKLKWSKCPKPGGIGIPPWEQDHIYIATMDHKAVLILNKITNKIVDRLEHPEMICPHSIAFLDNTKEIFVCDKWGNCVHVFSDQGEYLRQLCTRGKNNGQVIRPQGIAVSKEGYLFICDSGNERVLVLDSESGQQLHVIGRYGNKTEMNFPSSVALHYQANGDMTIIISDSGNSRIKMYNSDFQKIHEFGGFGKDRGSFKCPELVTVDPLGFILVGDCGNSRIQVFDTEGTFVRSITLKKSDKLQWISGLFVSQKLDILISDARNRCMYILA